jgi:hypothetical protein
MVTDQKRAFVLYHVSAYTVTVSVHSHSTYSTVQDHCDRRITLLGDLDISFVLLNISSKSTPSIWTVKLHWLDNSLLYMVTDQKRAFLVPDLQYSQRHSMINHCDRRITLLSDTDISRVQKSTMYLYCVYPAMLKSLQHYCQILWKEPKQLHSNHFQGCPLSR